MVMDQRQLLREVGRPSELPATFAARGRWPMPGYRFFLKSGLPAGMPLRAGTPS